jgi:hypothetical protein
MFARVSHLALWAIFVSLACESAGTAASSIYFAAERDLTAALMSVFITIVCGVVARESWRGLGRPSLARH